VKNYALNIKVPFHRETIKGEDEHLQACVHYIIVHFLFSIYNFTHTVLRALNHIFQCIPKKCHKVQ